MNFSHWNAKKNLYSVSGLKIHPTEIRLKIHVGV